EWRNALAAHELDLAKTRDPKDPTPWLYAALLELEQNEVNSSIRSLSRAQTLNNNRAIARSQLLLDQDLAVTVASQATAFRDAGFTRTSVETASRAVALDYANPSAHEFLADSYTSQDRVTLRNETARVSEYLIANLLMP